MFEVIFVDSFKIFKMKIFKKLDTVLASLGNVKSLQRTHVDTFTEEKIANVAGEKYGNSDFGLLYVEYQELGGYFFLNTTVISGSSFKSKKGATLEFKSKDNNLTLTSDDYMIESDFSNVSNSWITQINYPITEKEIQLVGNKKFDLVGFKVKKYNIEFKINN